MGGGGEEVAKLRKKLHVISIPLAQKKTERKRRGEEERARTFPKICENSLTTDKSELRGRSILCTYRMPRQTPSDPKRAEAPAPIVRLQLIRLASHGRVAIIALRRDY